VAGSLGLSPPSPGLRSAGFKVGRVDYSLTRFLATCTRPYSLVSRGFGPLPTSTAPQEEDTSAITFKTDSLDGEMTSDMVEEVMSSWWFGWEAEVAPRRRKVCNRFRLRPRHQLIIRSKTSIASCW